MRRNRHRRNRYRAGNITSLLGKTLAHDAAGRLSEATAIPPCPSGLNCSGAQTTLSRFNGWGQRFLRDTPTAQSVFSYGTEGFNLLSETTRNLSTSALSTTEHIWLPTASGPMPVAAVIDGVHYAVHADHLNTPRRLTDASQAVKWQWPYSGFGEIAPQATPAAGQALVNYGLRYPGQIDDGNGLFYNWHRFYDPRVGRYTKADPIGLDGGWNRFGYVGGNPLSMIDPRGLQVPGTWTTVFGGRNPIPSKPGTPVTTGPFGCVGTACLSWHPGQPATQMALELTFGGGLEFCGPAPPPPPQMCERPATGFQPPGIPIPEKYGGLFIGPSIKMNGQFCLRIGPHFSVPVVPSLDVGDLW